MSKNKDRFVLFDVRTARAVFGLRSQVDNIREPRANAIGD